MTCITRAKVMVGCAAVLTLGLGCASPKAMDDTSMSHLDPLPPGSLVDGDSKWRDASPAQPDQAPLRPDSAVATRN